MSDQADEENQAASTSTSKKNESPARESSSSKVAATNPDEYYLPDYFFDPKTNKVLIDPVVGPDGMSYDKSTISKEDHNKYYPNRALKDYIDTELERRELEPSWIGKLQKWEGSMRSQLAVMVERSVLPSREYRPLPDYYYCPITFEIIQEPVIGPSGTTYELEAIVQWLRNNNNTSPTTREPLHPDQLYDNLALEAILTEELNRSEDSIHESIRRWKQDVVDKRSRRARAPRRHGMDRSHEENTHAANSDIANGRMPVSQPSIRDIELDVYVPPTESPYPTTPEALEERRRAKRQYRNMNLTCCAILLVLVILGFIFPYTLVTVLYYVFALSLQCFLPCWAVACFTCCQVNRKYREAIQDERRERYHAARVANLRNTLPEH